MDLFIQELKKKCLVGLVGGSDIVKIAEQIGGTEGIPYPHPLDAHWIV